jgi:hypothetical protein
MSRGKAAFIALSFVALVFAASQSAQTPELPPGAMQNKARQACTTCHDAHIIVQQRLSKAAWAKEVDKMTKWGAILNPSDRDALVEYFGTNFPPEKPAYVAARSARRNSKIR